MPYHLYDQNETIITQHTIYIVLAGAIQVELPQVAVIFHVKTVCHKGTSISGKNSKAIMLFSPEQKSLTAKSECVRMSGVTVLFTGPVSELIVR